MITVALIISIFWFSWIASEDIREDRRIFGDQFSLLNWTLTHGVQYVVMTGLGAAAIYTFEFCLVVGFYRLFP